MNRFTANDILESADILLDIIEDESIMENRLTRLALAVDAYVYAVGFLDSCNAGFIESIEVPSENKGDLESRRTISSKFQELGQYWQALDGKINPAKTGELAVGDAIDDLLDISKELREVRWTRNHHGDKEALAALRFRHEHHLWMHIFHLRCYLEELIREG